MFKILKKQQLSENVYEYEIYAPMAVKNARAGQFAIIRVNEEGERIPFTICRIDQNRQSISLIVQTIGFSTATLAKMREGDCIADLVAPLGRATEFEGKKRIVLVGGGIGGAVILPQAYELKRRGIYFEVVLGARNKDLLLFVDEFERLSDRLYVVTGDGSFGQKGFVTTILSEIIQKNEYDLVICVGPLPMMRAVAEVTRGRIPTLASMNSIMVDGTGMCGCCRLTVDGQTRYACTEGPEFDAHRIDFEEAIMRSKAYADIEKEHLCRLK